MDNPWATKMEQFTRFNTEERRRLDEMIEKETRTFGAREDLLAEGSRSDHCHVLLAGLACRYKILPDGERQITAFLIPGDLCDAEVFILKEMDHAVRALVPCTAAIIHADVMRKLLCQP